MTKKMVSTDLTDVKGSLSGATLEEALHKIKRWIQEYGGNSTLDIGQECESYSYSDKEYAYVRIVGMREESDEAYTKRLAQESDYKKRAEERDAAEYKRLQEKFGEKK